MLFKSKIIKIMILYKKKTLRKNLAFFDFIYITILSKDLLDKGVIWYNYTKLYSVLQDKF